MATPAERITDITNWLDDLGVLWTNIKTDYTNASPSITDEHKETHLASIEFQLY